MVTVNVTDDDTQSFNTSVNMLTIDEGATGTVDVFLNAQPTANVLVTVGTSNGAVATAAPINLTFTPADFNLAQTITITGVQDADMTDGTANITLSATGITMATIPVMVRDDDVQRINSTVQNLTITEGLTGQILSLIHI